MFKSSARLSALLIAIAAFTLVCFQSFVAQPAFSAISSTEPRTQPLEPSTLVATAALPPDLVRSVLGGKPVYVLYVTRTEDNVLIRCYPGYEPTVTVRAMGPNPNASNVQKEGVMTCRPSS